MLSVNVVINLNIKLLDRKDREDWLKQSSKLVIIRITSVFFTRNDVEKSIAEEGYR